MELFLVLILTCIICAGVPILAFGYINGKIKFPNQKAPNTEKSNRTVLRWMVFILGTFLGCFLFPAYNITKNYGHHIQWNRLFLVIAECYVMGSILAKAFPYEKESVTKTVFSLLGFNCVFILAGMGCRYLLEFGEVSNTYNFTAPNIVVHLLTVNVFCMASWYFGVKQEQNRKRQG